MSKKNRTPEPLLPNLVKINPNSIVIYKPRKQFSGRYGVEGAQAPEDTTTLFEDPLSKINCTSCQPKKERKNISNGFLSDRASARLRKSIKYLLWLSGCFKLHQGKMVLKPSGHISFITLTLCFRQLHSDNYIKKYLLGQFLIELQTRCPNIHFIWRAEKQQNGNIHFHILCNKFVPWEWIAKTWNRLLKKEGYLLAYQTKFKNMWFEEYVKTIKDFHIDKLPQYKKRFLKQQQEGWCNPPSTHVEDMRTAKEIVYYMSKYLTKNSHNPEELTSADVEKYKVEGHLYFCSKEINTIKAPTEMISEAMARDIDFLYSEHPDRFLFDDFFIVIRFSMEDLYNLKCFSFYQYFRDNLLNYKPPDLFKP